MFSFAAILYIWSIIDKPPKPNKKDVIIIDKIEKLGDKSDAWLIPLVNSNNPFKRDFKASGGMLNIVNGIENIFNRLVVSKVEIMIEKRIIYPPIVKIDWIEFFIEFPSISPKFEIVINSLWDLFFDVSLWKSLSSFFFQFLKIIATIKADTKWTNRNLYPKILFSNKDIPYSWNNKKRAWIVSVSHQSFCFNIWNYFIFF